MKRTYLALGGALASVIFLTPSDADACGGCFSPPEVPTVVTDHRMILSIGRDRSTLYDQIRYTGSPESFGWVLPISGTVDVSISSDLVFTTLDNATQTNITPPPRNCPTRPDICNDNRKSNAAPSANESGGDGSGGVNVLKQEVVGPYETVQLSAEDPVKLKEWFTQNRYNIPPDVQPVIDKYVADKFNFLALKLVPGANVQSMRPVAVTTPNANTVLPLRMVAAGTGSQVGITLWVVGEGRYEPQNFAFFYLKAEEISWDCTQNNRNYIDLRAAKTTAGNGRVWEIESSTIVNRNQIENPIRNGTFTGNGPYPTTDEERAKQDYLPDAAKQLTAAQVRDADLGILVGNLNATRITRMRADLSRTTGLDADLQVIASQDQAELPRLRAITKELNEPLCPVWDSCESNRQAPRSEAVAASNGTGGETFGSSCGTTRRSKNTTVAALLGIVGLAEILRRRTRKR